MKLRHLLSLTLTAGAISPVVCLTSCGDPIKPVPTEGAAKYIYDRTFSICEWGPQYYCLGTAWIIDDATPDNENDYTYYLATNYHVICGMHDVMGTPRNTRYGKSPNHLKHPMQNYTRFQSFEEEDSDKFKFEHLAHSYVGMESFIDFYVVKANFGNTITIPNEIKSNLDELNEYRKIHGHITAFSDSWNTSSTYHLNKTYIGGYPAVGDGASWEYHELRESALGSYDKEYIEDGYVLAHGIDEEQTMFDFTPNYIANDNFGPTWMSGGASGSMLVSWIDEEWKVIAIYWGGWGNEWGTTFYPSFSIFNSTYQNYVSEYLKI